jgi:protein-serine/threonine kinase
MYFQRFPWSIAKGTSKEYSLYLEDYRSGPKEPVARPVGTKHPLKALQLLKPEESRMLVLAMLDPDCQRRYTIEQVVAHPWMQSIEVCVGIEASNHIHTHARKMADSVSFPDEHLTEGLEFDW